MSRGGFTLVEVIVALTLLSIGLLAVAGSAGMAALLMRESELQEGAAFAASQVLDSLMVADHPVSARQQRGPFELEWTVTRLDRAVSVVLLVSVTGSTKPAQQFTVTALRP